MIDPKYNERIRVILESKLNRKATPDELVNALKDVNIAAELLLALHEENRADIQTIAKEAGVVATLGDTIKT